MSSHCIGHEPCPSCGSRDNLARYADGGAFCFGCRYYEVADCFKPENMVIEEKVQKPYPTDATTHIPPANLDWLRQYLEDQEIFRWFRYSPILNRHVFLHREDNREYWEGRSVIKLPSGAWGYEKPKTVSHGTKPYLLFGADKGTAQCVIVEDVVSAIKVSRCTTALPLFGANLSLESTMRLIKDTQYKEVVIWLDADKLDAALKMAEKIHKFKRVRIITTDKDPKANPDEDIEGYLLRPTL